MKKKTIVTSAITTAAVLAALVATPTLAAVARGSDAPEAGQSMRSSQSHGQSDGTHGGRSHQGGKGQNRGGGTSDHRTGLADVTSGTMTDAQTTVLTAMAEEEKLAHDLYVAFDEQYDEAVFTRVTASEAKHLEAVRTLLERYELTDPTVGLNAGEFLSSDTQHRYDTLLAEGSISLNAALEAARTVEKTDIADLTAATEGVTAPDVLTVYERLLSASEKHLLAFGG
ncbi:MAG: DUF2202 domain-containing protein [Cryobacterium sp.]